MVFLQSHGISSAYAVKIYRRFGEGTIALVRSQPYRLTEVRGIGFHRADAIARSLGIPHDSPDRAAAGAVHVLRAALNAVAGLVSEQRTLVFGDHMSDLIHRKSVQVDLEYYESAQYYDTLHRAQQQVGDADDLDDFVQYRVEMKQRTEAEPD